MIHTFNVSPEIIEKIKSGKKRNALKSYYINAEGKHIGLMNSETDRIDLVIKVGQILDLIPICDNIKHLKSICNKCENVRDASFTLRTSNSTEQVSVGGNDSYMAVCRGCWLK